MAKWCGAIVGLYFIFSFYLTTCNSSDVEKDNLLHRSSYSDWKLRKRRLATDLTEYKSIPDANVNTSPPTIDHTISSTDNKTISDVKQEPPGATDTENYTQDDLSKHNITTFNEDYHLFYNSSMVVNPALAKDYWESFKNVSANTMLSNSHRKAMTVQLSFDFPFYGHLVRNVTVATAGFLYTGEFVHSWLAATQYIAPLMANFDTSLSNDSFVKFADNGTAFTVIWENVALQERQDVGTFTFSSTLHSNGDIVFTYFSVPILIESIQDLKRPVKVGLSDAYLIDKVVSFARGKTIYEYHRVNFDSQDIRNSTIIYLTAQPTCLSYTDCMSCLTHNTKFKCAWCPTLKKCSTGTDRKRQDWLHKGCDKTQIEDNSLCPEIGQEGNNAGQETQEVSLESAEMYPKDSSHETSVREDNLLHRSSYSDWKLRKRRLATDLTEYKSIPDANVNTSPPTIDHTISSMDNKTISDVKQVPPGATDTGGSTNSSSTTTTTSTTVSPDLSKEQHLLGVNGTGQRKEIPSTPKPAVVSEPINPPSKTTKLSTPKKVFSDTKSIPTEELIDTIDVAENYTQDDLSKHNITTFNEDYHLFYNSSMVVNPTLAKDYWESFKNVSANTMLSKSHRRAMTVQLSFDFPFYGHLVRNVTVATGGFLYTGEYVHSWLAATQYIAPLMANFDTSLSNDSFVKFADNGTAFTVIWENVALQDRQDVGTFTFSSTLHSNGDIVFTYFSVPILIESIQDDKHPVKVGLSDAYIIDKVVFFARRKTIYEYHRVNFGSQDIRNSTIIYLTAQPTCLSYTDCMSCLTHNTKFKCAWCPTLKKCSTGTDRKRQDWLHKGCDKTQIEDNSLCPAIGQKGNNAGQETQEVSLESAEMYPKDSSHETSVRGKKVIPTYEKSSMEEPTKKGERSSVGLVLGLMLPICLVMSALVWILYAYRNPHTKSGQLLIQYRPSQWTWRRGEARYTAATIHM